MMMLFCLFWFSVPLRNILSEISQSTYRWDAVGGKAHLLVRVKIGDGLDEADTPHLEQIVRILPPLVEALDHGKHQPQIALDELFPGRLVPFPGPAQEGIHLRLRQNRQSGCVYAADLYFPLHGVPPDCENSQSSRFGADCK